jgi:IS1 family transposase
MSYLSLAKQTQIISGLVEGNSIRAMERTTGAHRDTIMRLALRVGTGCAKIMDEEMRDLRCKRIQADEIWAFVGKKQKNVAAVEDPAQVGDFWTFVAIDPETKLVPSYRVGKRDRETTVAFCADLASRLTNRCQLSTDAFPAYTDAIEKAFGADVDYGQVVKFYDSTHGTGRYSPAQCIGAKRTPIAGGPVHEHISTSHIERQNLTMRMSMRRFTRLTNGFSKTVDGLRAAVSLHFAHYNFVRVHQSLRVTPAVEAGVSQHVWELEDLVERTAWAAE